MMGGMLAPSPDQLATSLVDGNPEIPWAYLADRFSLLCVVEGQCADVDA